MALDLSKLTVGSIVVVRWFDAYQESHAFGAVEELLDSDGLECRDVGFFMGSKGRYITLATELQGTKADVKQYRHAHHIPKVNVISIEVLERGV